MIDDYLLNILMLLVQLNEIVMLLKLLQDPLPIVENERKSIEAIHSMIETSATLQNRIKIYLSDLKIIETDLILLHQLFQYYNPILLFNVDKQTYLLKIFNQSEQRSCDFYTEWFQYFLCDNNYVETTQEWYYFEILMNKWFDKVIKNNDIFRQIMLSMDNLLNHLSRAENNQVNKRRFTYFMKHMIDRNFKRGMIYYEF
jgi:hypothetical protein